MKVGKAYLGQIVQLTWLDTAFNHINVNSQGLPLKGRASLARQREYGQIDDVTEVVVRLVHTETTHPGDDKPGGWSITWIPEEVVVEVIVLAPRPQQPEAKEGL